MPRYSNGPVTANIAITEALGLDPTKIRANGLTIRLDRELGPLIDVEMFLTGSDGKPFTINEEVATELKRYKLVAIDDEDDT